MISLRTIFLILLIFSFFNCYSQRLPHKNDTVVIIIKKKNDTLPTTQVKPNQKVDSLIKYWIGKPYLYGGTTKKGIDCSAFTQMTYKAIFNYILPRTAQEQFLKAKKVSISDIKIGDLLFFISSQSPSGWHVAFYIGNNKYIHAANKKVGVIVSDLTTDVKKRIYSVGRFISE